MPVAGQNDHLVAIHGDVADGVVVAMHSDVISTLRGNSSLDRGPRPVRPRPLGREHRSAESAGALHTAGILVHSRRAQALSPAHPSTRP
eukprot:scaffold72067_cov63-Phaeocystis_antarctica.AAC.3